MNSGIFIISHLIDGLHLQNSWVRLFGLLMERRKINCLHIVKVVSDHFLQPSHFVADCLRENLLKVTQQSLEDKFYFVILNVSAELKCIKDPGKKNFHYS